MSDEVARRLDWWGAYFDTTQAAVVDGRPAARRFCCPACAFPTLTARGDFQTCSLCDWFDDGAQTDTPGSSSTGANPCSVADARERFAAYRTVYAPSTEGFFAAQTVREVREALIHVFIAMEASRIRAWPYHQKLWRVADDLEGLARWTT